ncbi:MAG: hypothetical protein KDA78_16510, partial [Planctomycetaceae bacterium]|nr:hypothetical protein [Planctomycetaceae bacterium]
GHILTSQDGKTWKEVLTTKARVNPVEYGNERFVAGVSGYPAGKFLWSTDAENWQEGIRLDDKQCTHFRRGAFGNSRFVITGNHGGNSPSWIAVTSNGEDVLAIDHSLEKLREICFAEGVFVVVGEGIRHNSVDGINWKSSQVDPAEPLRWVVHNGTQFFCGGGKSVYVSDDGVNWDTHPMRPRGNVLWMNGEQAIATGWPGKMFYSADTGSTWKQSAEMTPNGINVIVRAVQSH